MVGENAEYFFRYVTTSEYPGSYDSRRRTLRLEKVRKSDLQVVEHFPLRDTVYSQNMDTGGWTERSQAVRPFDLSGYLTRNSVHLPFSTDLVRTFAFDSSGVSEVFEDGRIQLADGPELMRQIPKLGEEPRVVGIEMTDYEPSAAGRSFVYLRVWSNSAADDADWSEDLLVVSAARFR